MYLASDSTSDSFEFLVQANKTSERFWKMYRILAIYSLTVSVGILAIGSVMLCLIMNGSFDVKSTFNSLKLMSVQCTFPTEKRKIRFNFVKFDSIKMIFQFAVESTNSFRLHGRNDFSYFRIWILCHGHWSISITFFFNVSATSCFLQNVSTFS